jgi:hypothetical protein
MNLATAGVIVGHGRPSNVRRELRKIPAQRGTRAIGAASVAVTGSTAGAATKDLTP